MQQMQFSELKRLTFCNSDKLYNKQFIIGGICHEWVGIGMVECNIEKDKEQIEIVE